MNDRHIRRPSDEGYTPTTTHAAWGAGNPRLRITRDDERTEFALSDDVVRIGSAEDNELRLADTDPVHATITHDDRDEYVLTLHGEGETNASLGVDATHADENSETLRTRSALHGGSVDPGVAREEFADHGRPYGGRAGGEYSDQPLQPPRPDYDEGRRAMTTARDLMTPRPRCIGVNDSCASPPPSWRIWTSEPCRSAARTAS